MAVRDKDVISATMRRVRSKDTGPELALRRALSQGGLRYRLHYKKLPGNPDIVFPRSRVAVFVDGDFWHGNQWRLRGLRSLEQQFQNEAKADYWIPKINRTIIRDTDATHRLEYDGWRVVRVWESDLKKDLDGCVAEISKAVRSRGRVFDKTFAEFFAGIGLVRLGLERAGWKVTFANDIDEKKKEMYWENFTDAAETYATCDVHALSGSDIPLVTLATASFPCTDLSLAGNRRGLAGAQSGTLWAFFRLLEEMDGQRPPLVLLENVPGFLTSHGGNDFADAIAALNRLNYSCDAFVLDAINFVPQSRQRLFVVGVFDAPSTPNVEEKLSKRDARLQIPQLTDFMTASRNLAWHVLPIPSPPARTMRLSSLIERLPSNSPLWWDEERVGYLLKQMSPKHRRLVDSLLNSKGVRYATVYRRVRAGKSMAEVRADGIAGCLRTPKGGSSRQILLALRRGKVAARFLTPREYARLMGAADYDITVQDNQAYFGFGDAVCVPAIEWIGKKVLNPLVRRITVEAATRVSTPV